MQSIYNVILIKYLLKDVHNKCLQGNNFIITTTYTGKSDAIYYRILLQDIAY